MVNNKLQELIDLINRDVSINNIVSEYVQLEKKGNNYIGLCPFHQDTNPSMSVSASKRIYKCFSCGAGGNVINFIMNIEGIDFLTALKKISDKENIDWKKYINNSYEKKIDPKIRKIWEINQEALNFFKYQLNDNKNVKEYLKARRLNYELVNEFEIGWSGDEKQVINFLLKKGFKEEELLWSGIGNLVDDKIISYFINRLIFPIKDENENIVGFSGRIINNSKKYAKYINTKETMAFNKGKILYNYNKAKSYISIKKKVIIVEGYMDVIAYYKAGINNVVAMMGTNLSEIHQKLIKQITNKIILSFDNDIPGINSLIKFGKQLLAKGFDVFVFLPKKVKDIDEFLNKNNNEKLNESLNNESILFINFLIEKFIEKNSDMPNFEELNTILKTINLLKQEIEKDYYINKLSKRFNIEKNKLKINNNNNNNNNIVKKSRIEKEQQKINENIYEFELEILKLISDSKDFLNIVEEKKYIFKFRKLNEIYNSLKTKKNLDEIIDNENNLIIQNIKNQNLEHIKNKKEEIKILIRELNKLKTMDKNREILKEIQNEEDHNERKFYLKMLKEK